MAEDGKQKFYEVILVDPHSIHQEPRICAGWQRMSTGVEQHGQDQRRRKGRGQRHKGIGTEKTR